MTRVVELSLAAMCLGACGGSGPPAASPAAESRDDRGAHQHDHHAAHHHGGDDTGGPLGHRFEDPNEWVDRFEGPDRDAWQRPDHVVALLELEPGMTVADVGAGTGYFAPHLSRAVGDGGRVLALDIEQGMVDYIAARAEREGLANVEARVVAFDDPQLPAAAVDRVIVVDTWHHIPDRAAYAAKLGAGLRPGGAVFVIDFTMDTERGPPKHHRIEASAVVDELAAGGLIAEILADEQLPDQYVVVGRRP